MPASPFRPRRLAMVRTKPFYIQSRCQKRRISWAASVASATQKAMAPMMKQVDRYSGKRCLRRKFRNPGGNVSRIQQRGNDGVGQHHLGREAYGKDWNQEEPPQRQGRLTPIDVVQGFRVHPRPQVQMAPPGDAAWGPSQPVENRIENTFTILECQGQELLNPNSILHRHASAEPFPDGPHLRSCNMTAGCRRG